MNLQELNQLDFSNLGDWPAAAKTLAILMVCGLVAGAGYYFDTQHQLKSLKQVELQERDLF